MSSPIEVLREAVRAVPALRYALGVAGILAAVALVKGFGINAQTAVLGAIGMLALMVALVLFARLTKTAPQHFVTPMLVLMWSMLVITVATAGLLFSSMFFDWPLPLSRLLAPEPAVPGGFTETGEAVQGAGASAEPVARLDPAQEIIVRELAKAQSQQLSGDFAGAWATVAALAEAHPNPDVERAQALLAMVRLRDARPGPGRTFTELATPLLPILHEVAASDTGVFGADALAHIGWGQFLLWRDGSLSGEDPASAVYARALERDPDNPYAHAMWGHWLLWRTPNLPEARRHFAAALASGRESAWVRELALAAYLNKDAFPDAVSTLIAMQSARDELPQDQRDRIASRLYSSRDRALWAELVAAADPREHLAAFEWLLAGGDFESSGSLALRHAQLVAGAGECERAKPLYEDLMQRNLSSISDDELRAELATCKPHA
jgi:hypothetical protein